MSDIQLVLYSGSRCHLCHDAKNIVLPLLPPGVALKEIIIDDNPALQALYGIRIPVLAVLDSNDRLLSEKNWPFSAGQVKRVLAEYLPID